MFENLMKFFKKGTKRKEIASSSRETAKERLHLVLMQDRANVSVDFLELMKQEIIEVIKKYIDVDESAIDVRLTNKENVDGTNGAPALYANIPILNIKNEVVTEIKQDEKETEVKKETTEKPETEKVEKEEIKAEEATEIKEDKEVNKQEEVKKEEKKEDKTKEKEHENAK